MKKQHLRLRNITLIGIQGRARIHGQIPFVDSYLFDDVTRGLYTSPVQISINLLNLRLTRIGIIKLKNTSTSLNVKIVNCTVSKLSKSPIVDSSSEKTTVILKKSIVHQVSKGFQVKSKEFSFSIESSKIDNSGRYYPEQGCPQFIVTSKSESLVANFSKSLFKYTFLIDLAAYHQKKSNVSITDSIFDDDIKNFKDNGCFSGIILRNTTALIVNSNFTNFISRKSLIKAIDSFVTFKECIFSNISSKLGMFSLSSSIIASLNKTDAIDSKLNEFNYGSVYLKSTEGIFQNCTFHNNTVNGQYGNGGAIYMDSSNITLQQCLFKGNTATYTGGAIAMLKTRGIFVNCTFEKNSADRGGAVFTLLDTSHLTGHSHGGAIHLLRNKDLIVRQCLFTENTATSIGGAIEMLKTRGIFVNCTFENNSADTGGALDTFQMTGHNHGGAIHLIRNKDLIVKQCLFTENTATYSGGAIQMIKTQGIFVNCTFEKNSVKSRLQRGNFGGAVCALDNSHLTMHQCIFKENTATYTGGATYIQKSHSLFESCIFEKNKVNSLQQNTSSGGAISATGANKNITIKQCLFKGNTATYSGGAISMRKTRGTFVNCTFEKNSAETSGAVFTLDTSHLTGHSYGGAIHLVRNKDLIVQQCLFTENTATYSGGAIKMIKTQGIFVNCTFEKNSVKSRLQRDDFGGAVCALDNSHLTMHQCIFKENTATYTGGATYIQKSHSLFESCIFEKNKVNNLNQYTRGGAISATGANKNITIKQCLFKGNTATYSGGAISMQKTRGIFVNCTFEKSSAETSGAVFTLDTSHLTGYGNGGAIHLVRNKDLIVQQCLFIENTATYSGGAIQMIRTQGIFVNCTFEKNSVKGRLQRDDFGGAVCALDNSHLTMHQCIFKENTATYTGGATYIQKSHSLFESCIFEKNKVNNLNQYTRGGAITATGANKNITIKQCLFKDNSATYSGGAIQMIKTRGIFVNCTFEKNSVKSRLQRGGFGGAVCALDNSHLTMHQCIFKENTATYTGGATYIQKSHSLFESCIFEKNKVNSLQQNTSSGGAISATSVNKNITIKQCLFKGNTATHSGGAISMQKTRGIFVNCTFEKNSADRGGAVFTLLDTSHLTGHSHGGAIHLVRNKDLIVQQCLFTENTATYSGGAIEMIKTQGIFVNCTFEKNSVKSRLQRGNFGGAVCALDNSHLTMHQCIFKENTATCTGGATYIQESHSLFESCIFERNKVNSPNQNSSGGAIAASGSGTKITIKQCLFKENAVIYNGGAIGILRSRSLLLKNTTFVRNTMKTLTVLDTGGAIHLTKNSDITVEQSLFKKNTATYSGGAVFMQESQGSFENCTFVDNAVLCLQILTFGGAVSSTHSSFCRMTQCLFKKNNATFYGGACYIQRSQSSFENCTFEGKV